MLPSSAWHSFMPRWQALVEIGGDRAILLAHHEHRIFTHVGIEEVTGIRNHAIVGEEQPGAGEHTLKLQFVDRLVSIDRRLDRACLSIDQSSDVEPVIHICTSLRAARFILKDQACEPGKH